VAPGYTVPVYYDSLIAKLIAWGEDRPHAVARLARALSEYDVLAFRRRSRSSGGWSVGRVPRRSLRHDVPRPRAQRARRPSFSEMSDASEELAAIAVALHAYLRAPGAAPIAPDRPRQASGGRQPDRWVGS